MGVFFIIQPNGMQLSQKSLNTSLALFELINQIRNCSQKTWKDGSKFQTLSWARNFIQRTVWNGGWGEEGGEKVHNRNEGFVYYRPKQVKHSLSLGLRINAHQPQSSADRYYSCHTGSVWMPIFMSLFSGLELRENPPTNLTLHWKNLHVILKSSNITALSPKLLLFSAFLWTA